MNLILEKKDKILSVYWDFNLKKYKIIFNCKKYLASDITIIKDNIILTDVIYL